MIIDHVKNMDVLLGQQYEIDNVVSHSGKYSLIEFQEVLSGVITKFKPYALNEGNYIITTTKRMELVNNNQILDVEIIIPIIQNIDVDNPYVIKNKIRITNALYTIVEDVANLIDTMNHINQYIMLNKLQPITSPYIVQTKKSDRIVTEIYVGINPNIL